MRSRTPSPPDAVFGVCDLIPILLPLSLERSWVLTRPYMILSRPTFRRGFSRARWSPIFTKWMGAVSSSLHPRWARMVLMAYVVRMTRGGSCHCPTMIKISKCDGDGDGKTVCALRTMQAEIRVSISAENQRGKNKSSHDTG